MVSVSVRRNLHPEAGDPESSVNCNDFIFMFGGKEEFFIHDIIEYSLGENTQNPPEATVDIQAYSGANENIGNQAFELDQECNIN